VSLWRVDNFSATTRMLPIKPQAVPVPEHQLPEDHKKFKLKRELDMGDILTSLSIIVSVLALGLTWRSDNQLKTKEYADKIRGSTATVTGKIERWG
jgi:hypothetical protein